METEAAQHGKPKAEYPDEVLGDRGGKAAHWGENDPAPHKAERRLSPQNGSLKEDEITWFSNKQDFVRKRNKALEEE